MTECKAQIDPQAFGAVKEKAEHTESTLIKVSETLELFQKEMRKETSTIKYLVLANMVGGVGAVVAGSDAKEILLALFSSVGDFVQITYASL